MYVCMSAQLPWTGRDLVQYLYRYCAEISHRTLKDLSTKPLNDQEFVRVQVFELMHRISCLDARVFTSTDQGTSRN